MSVEGKIQSLFIDREQTQAVFPTTKIKAVTDDNGVGLNAILEDMLYAGDLEGKAETAPIDADNLGGRPASEYATQNYVATKIAEAQLSGEGSDIDLSGYATKDELNSHTNDKNNPHGVTIEQIGAAPAGYGLGGEAKQLTSADNLDDIWQNGNYWWTWSVPTNAYVFDYDTQGAYEYMRVDGENSGVFTQTLRSHHAPNIGKTMVRHRIGDTITPWVRCDEGAFAPSGYGYGERAESAGRFTTEAEMNTALSNVVNSMGDYESKQILFVDALTGEYSCTATVYRHSSSYALVEVRRYADGAIYHKKLKGGTWETLEWVTPPMELGKEYRTTERCGGKVVYAKAISLGTLTSNDMSVSVGAGTIYTVRATGRMVLPSGSVRSLPCVDATYGVIGIQTNHQNVWVRGQNDITGGGAEVVVWYTKEAWA